MAIHRKAPNELTGEHDTVSTIENGISDIAGLSTGGARLVGHRLKHLGGTDNWLAHKVAPRDCHLLREEDLLRRDLNAQVATSHHHAISSLDDLIETKLWGREQRLFLEASVLFEVVKFGSENSS